LISVEAKADPKPQASSLIFLCLPSEMGLLAPRLAVQGSLGEGEENDLFAGHGADVAVQAHDPDAGDILDQRFQKRSGRFDEMGPHLLEQGSPLLGGGDLTSCCSAAVKTPRSRTTMRSPI